MSYPKFLPTCLSTYRPGHSTETALLKVVNDLFLSLNKGNIPVLALLDFSSAFDTIGHPILVHRLHTDFGFTDTVLQWFSSYLTDRTHYVSLSNHCSAFTPVHSGVPQGSVLGPMRFTMNVRPLSAIIDSHSIIHHSFADDLQLQMSAPTDRISELLHSIQSCICDVKALETANMLKLNDNRTELMLNTIPHMWKLANIIPIPKPDKDHNTGTSFRPMSLLSVISNTLEKALLPYITNNIPQHHTQHGFKAKHSTTTALHNINNTIASGFNQRIPPARTIAVALDMSKAFDTVNIHTLTKKLLDTQIPPILIKLIANYIKGRKAFTTYNNKTSTQRQFKTGVPQGGVLSPTLFNIYTSDIPSPPPNINITVYADDITMTSTDTNKQIAQAKLQPYLQEIASWTQQNQHHLNPDKTTSTLFTPDPAEYSTQLTLNIDNVVIPTVKNHKILGLTFDPKLTYNSHIRKTSDKARNTLKLLKALTSTKWRKQKETIVATYKAITRPILEYASTIWSPIASTTGITKLQTIQNMALRIATGCTSDTNIQHLHNETNILPLNAHLKLHSSQLRQKSQHPTHPLHKFTVLTENERHKNKQSLTTTTITQSKLTRNLTSSAKTSSNPTSN